MLILFQFAFKCILIAKSVKIWKINGGNLIIISRHFFSSCSRLPRARPPRHRQQLRHRAQHGGGHGRGSERDPGALQAMSARHGRDAAQGSVAVQVLQGQGRHDGREVTHRPLQVSGCLLTTRPSLPRFFRLKIRRTTSPNYMKLTPLRISRV